MSETVEELQGNLYEIDKEEEKEKRIVKLFEWQLGKDILELFNDKQIIEIMLNQDKAIWVEKFGIGKMKTSIVVERIQAKKIIEIIASYNKKVVTRQDPRVSAVLPNGSRFEGIMFDAVQNKPIFSIRKRPERVFTLDEYVESRIITQKQKDFLVKSILNKKNILIVGGTSSGKTTFINGCINELSGTEDRVFLLEDTPELQCNIQNSVFLTTTHHVSMKMLLQSSMRLNPDRIIVGELRRGEETLELLKAWNSGHAGGLSTIHANDCQSGLMKLEQYLAEVVESDQKKTILEAVDIVVNLIKNEENKRVVREIKVLKDYDEKKKEYVLEEIA